MKKNNINIIKIGLNIILVLGLFCYARPSFAEGIDPYSYDNTRKLQPVLQESFLPPILRSSQMQRKDLPDAAPQAPALVTDADGNKFLYQDGQLLLKIDVQGNRTFYIKGQARYEKDDEENLTQTYEYSGARTIIKNEFGEVIGYRESGLGGLLLRGYDEKYRQTQSYEYEGRRLKADVDLLTNSRTLYNDRGKPDKEINFEGAVVATYHYGGNGKLLSKIDNYGNKTVYDDIGRPLFTYRATGAVIETYNWASLNKYSVTDEHGRTVYYDHDRQRYETQLVETPEGVVTRTVKTYNWQGTKLISSLDIDMEETSYYENGRPTHTTYKNGLIVGLWKYDEETGVLISHTERSKTTYYDHGRAGFDIERDPNWDPDSGLTLGYKPLFYDEIKRIILKYKNTSQSIMPYVDEFLKNEWNAVEGKGNEGVEEIPSDNEDNGRHIGPPEVLPPAAPAIGDAEGPGRRVGPPLDSEA